MIVRCLSVRNNVFVKNTPFSGIRIFIVVIVLATSSTWSTLISILLISISLSNSLYTFIGDEADTNVCFYPSFCKMEHRTHFQSSFGDTEGTFYHP